MKRKSALYIDSEHYKHDPLLRPFSLNLNSYSMDIISKISDFYGISVDCYIYHLIISNLLFRNRKGYFPYEKNGKVRF